MPTADDHASLWRRFIVAVTLGELIGFGGIPIAGGFVALTVTQSLADGPRALALYVVSVVGGLGEGAVLAWFQWRVLRTVWPRLDARRFISHTAFAAALAWALGMLPSTLDDIIGLSATAQVALWIPAMLVILPSIGWAQARVLRLHVPDARGWIVANVLGWLAGLPWTFVAPALLPDDAAPWAFAVAFIVAGVLMGATVGAVTGRWLVRQASTIGAGDSA